uniref:Fatty acid-binding protein, heart-like n=1 Tax=Gadus morhua TaxID=8049 RepID=A0A8C5BM08_GADMO
MVEQFVGSWKMVSSENFDDFLKAMGVGFAIRQIASRTKPSLIVTLDQGIICLKMLSSFKTTEVKFKLNQAFDETTADGRNTTVCQRGRIPKATQFIRLAVWWNNAFSFTPQNIVTLENGKLVQIQSWDGKETTIEREIVDGKLVTKCKIGNVVAVRTFQREA